MITSAIIVLVLYALGIGIIAYFSRKKSGTLNDFFLGGKGVGAWMSAFAYGTTYFSAVIFIGYAGKFGAGFGAAALWIGIGNAVIGAFLAWKILAKRTREMTRKLNVKTMSGFLEARYKSKNIKLIAAIIIVIFLIPYSASVYQGLGELFSAIFGGNTDTTFKICVTAMAALTAVYLFFGGYLATVLSDFMQGIIMLIGVVIMTYFIYSNDVVGGLGQALNNLASEGQSFIPGGDILFDVIVIVLLTSLGAWGLPQMIHKFYAIKDTKMINKAAIICTVFALVIGMCAYGCGAVARYYPETLGLSGDSVMPAVIISALPAALIGVIAVLLLAASMSTLAALSLVGAGAFSIDIYQGYINKKIAEKKLSVMSRITCVVLIIFSALIAIFRPAGIVELMGLSWGTLAGCFIGPYVWGLYLKRANKIGCWYSVISGLILTLTLTIIFFPQYGMGKSPLIGVICIFNSLIFTPVISLLTSKTKTAVAEIEVRSADMEEAKG